VRKHNQIRTLGAPHYKGQFQFLRKLKDFVCTIWSEKYDIEVYSFSVERVWKMVFEKVYSVYFVYSGKSLAGFYFAIRIYLFLSRQNAMFVTLLTWWT